MAVFDCITTSRLKLRPLGSQDANDYYQIVKSLRNRSSSRFGICKTPVSCADFFNRNINNHSSEHDLFIALEDLQCQELLGAIILSNHNDYYNVLNAFIRSSSSRKGFMTEAFVALIKQLKLKNPDAALEFYVDYHDDVTIKLVSAIARTSSLRYRCDLSRSIDAFHYHLLIG